MRPTLSDSLLGQIFSAHPNSNTLIRILGIVLTFHEPPSPCQIENVLNLRPGVVQSTLYPLRTLFTADSLQSSNSLIRVFDRSSVERFIFDNARARQFFVDRASCHTLVASWCLRNDHELPRYIFYARKLWAYHVRLAAPSPALVNALRVAQIPYALSSHAKLPMVIEWLKKLPEPPADVISQFQAHYTRTHSALTTTGLRVEAMGGRISTVFTKVDHLAPVDRKR